LKFGNMSRLGKQPIEIPSGTTVVFKDALLTVKGPKGELARIFDNDGILISIEGNTITTTLRKEDDNFTKALWGTYASHIRNMITGVNDLFVKKLILDGVGFKWEIKDKNLHMALGFSHPVIVPIPDGVNVTIEKSELTVSGINKELVGQFSAEVRGNKKPEPYKGKGIRYSDEVIRRKQGKKTA